MGPLLGGRYNIPFTFYLSLLLTCYLSAIESYKTSLSIRTRAYRLVN